MPIRQSSFSNENATIHAVAHLDMSGNAANTNIMSISVDGSLLHWNANDMSAASVRVYLYARARVRLQRHPCLRACMHTYFLSLMPPCSDYACLAETKVCASWLTDG